MAEPLTLNELKVLFLNNQYKTERTPSKTSLPVILNPEFVQGLISGDIAEYMPDEYLDELKGEIDWRLTVPLSVEPINQTVRRYNDIAAIFKALFVDEPDVANFINNLILISASYQRNPEFVLTEDVEAFHNIIKDECLASPFPVVSSLSRQSGGLSEVHLQRTFARDEEPYLKNMTDETEYKKYWKSFYEMLVNGIPMPMKYNIDGGRKSMQDAFLNSNVGATKKSNKKISFNLKNMVGTIKDYAGELMAIDYNTVYFGNMLTKEDDSIATADVISPKYAISYIFSKKSLPLLIRSTQPSAFNTSKVLSWLPLYVWSPIEGTKETFMNWDFIPF